MDLIQALVPYILLVLGMSACLAQFFLQKRELWVLSKKAEEREARLVEALRMMQEELEQLREQGEAQAIAFPAGSSEGGMNFSKRSRVLRMHRRGERPDQIAAALNVPRNEVDLLLKLNRVTDNGGCPPEPEPKAYNLNF